jgi:hypothetical protein
MIWKLGLKRRKSRRLIEGRHKVTADTCKLSKENVTHGKLVVIQSFPTLDHQGQLECMRIEGPYKYDGMMNSAFFSSQLTSLLHHLSAPSRKSFA